ncbi:MAG: DUF3276 family protein [Saprospiraceae bacterium]
MFDKNFTRPQPEYTAKIKSGDRRTYFIDVQKSKFDDYFLIISESTRKPNSDQNIRNKIHVYKEDIHKFIAELENAVSFLKTNLMPNYDFERKNKEFENREWGKHDSSQESRGNNDEILPD